MQKTENAVLDTYFKDYENDPDFIAEGLAKIEGLRGMLDDGGHDCVLEVDGGVKVENIGAIAHAGATAFVAGSAVFGSPDYRATLAAMRQEIAAVRRAPVSAAAS